MTYIRVVPRDLFNESNLLKCLGHIALGIHDGKLPGLRLLSEDFDSGFVVEQRSSTGEFYCPEFQLYNPHVGMLYHAQPLNSREPYALFLFDDQDEEYAVFNDDGSLHDDMRLFQERK